MIIIALGANLFSSVGPPEATLAAAIDRLDQRGVRTVAQSHFYRTTAWPDPSDPSFVNAVCLVSSPLDPEDLLGTLHSVETSFGRNRSVFETERYAPRTLDIDLIDYNGLIQPGPPVLPHPRVCARSFVLVPLRDVAPDWQHPESGKSLHELIAQLGPEAEAPIRL